MTGVVFYFFAVVGVVSALLCITRRNPVASAFWLISTMLALAAIYVLLNAQFIGVIQVLVYAGAVMVLFLFVIMLLNLGHAGTDIRPWPSWVVALALTGGLAMQLLVLGRYTPERAALEFTRSSVLSDPALVFTGDATIQAATQGQGVVGAVAAPLFEIYLVPFEITSILLLAAIIGAVVLAKRKI